MKKMAEIMEELGFNPDGSDEVKKAFIKNLIKQAHVSEFSRPNFNEDKNKECRPEQSEGSKDADQYQQISLFDQKLSS